LELGQRLQRNAQLAYCRYTFYRVDIAYSLCKKMDKGISIRSCKGPGCPFFISYDESRRDKEFCSKNCKEKWRYHHVVKPKRQGQAI
jgi:hypothetical protein